MFLNKNMQEKIQEERKNRVKLENAVMINIWPSKDNKYVKGHNCGHISITLPERFLNEEEKKNNYVSLWPEEGTKQIKLAQRLENYITGRGKYFMLTYEDDAMNEGACEAEDEENIIPLHAGVRLVLYGLNTDEMFKKFNKLEETTTGWRMIGSNLLTQVLHQDGHALESCASFVLRILKAGGFYAEMTSQKQTSLSSKVSCIATPDEMIQQLIAAKKQEQKLYSKTIQWQTKGETSFAELQKAYEPKENNNNYRIN